MTDRLSPEREAETRKHIAELIYPTYGQRDTERTLAIADAVMPAVRAALLAELAAVRAERDQARQRVAELEKAAIEGRAALGSLCYDLEDPGTAALGALYLLTQATTWTEDGPDFASDALAQHDAKVIRKAAEVLEAADRDEDTVNLLYLLADGGEHFGSCHVNATGHRIVNGHCLYCSKTAEEASR